MGDVAVPEPGTKVILVEDDPDDAYLVRSALRKAGANGIVLTHVTDLTSAIDESRGGSFDVALLDLGLPESVGFETFRRFHSAVPDIPVVVLSVLEDQRVAIRAVSEGAQDYLVKGRAEGDEVARALRYAIERHRLNGEIEAGNARRTELENLLRRSQSSHIWFALFRTLGRGASGILVPAGVEAGLSAHDYIMKTWSPPDEDAFVTLMKQHLTAVDSGDVLEVRIDRSERKMLIRTRGGFETTLGESSPPGPNCHFTRGIMTGIAMRLLASQDLVSDEVACQSRGDAHCEFMIRPLLSPARGAVRP